MVIKMPAKVYLQKCESYNVKLIKDKINTSLEAFGGIEKFIQKGQKVLLKPNILANAPQEKAVTTNPAVVRAVAEIVIEAGGNVSIGDSPAVYDLEKCAKACGIAKVASDLNIPLVPFDDTIFLDIPTKSDYKRIEIARAVWDADVIINIPKVKTHVYMYLTLSVKNCFGIIKGIRKAKWHLEAGKSREQFSKMLISCLQAMKPDLTIVDGIVGMEGDGPQSGIPRKLDFIITGTDCVAIDRVICELLKMDIDKFTLMKIAKEYEAGETDLSKILVLGESLNNFHIENFKPPARSPFMPPILYKHFREHLTDTPVIGQKKCKKCGDCMKICPAGAISCTRGEKIKYHINPKKCIRCFCCHEICPHRAIYIKKGFLLKIVEIVMK